MGNNNEWLKDAYVQKWLTKVASRTRENYIANFPEFLNFMNMTPSEMIRKRASDLTSSEPEVRAYFEDKAEEYLRFLEARYDNEYTIKGFVTAMRSFFTANHLKLSCKLVIKPKGVKRSEWIPTNEDIRKLYAIGNPKERALLLVLYQSGFSEVDVSELCIEDIKNLYEQDDNYFIVKYREKTNFEQATCLSSEAIYEVKAMLIERGKPTSGPLFVIERGKRKTERIEVRYINDIIKGLVEKAFPERVKEFKTKSLRSAYNSALLRAGVQPQELKDVMMGHKRMGARSHYAYDEATIKKWYNEAFQHLSVNHGAQARKSLDEIRQTIQGQATEISNLKTEVETLKSMLQAIGIDKTAQTKIKEALTALKQAQQRTQ